MRSSNEKAKILLWASVCLIIVFVLVFGVRFLIDLEHKKSLAPNDEDYEDDVIQSAKIVYNDNIYYEKRSINTVLIIGIDEDGVVKSSDSYNNTQQADFFALMLHDPNTDECSIIYLNRDTMTDIPVLGIGGKNAGHIYAQLALSHTYGNGLELSCKNTISAVSNLLLGVTIDHYISLNMDAVGIINDYIGGVEVTIKDDFSLTDPDLIIGETIKLNAKQALAYVRSRSSMPEPTNIARMARQQEYIKAFMEKIHSLPEASNPDFYIDAYDLLIDYMITDMRNEALAEIFVAFSECDEIRTYTLQGSAVNGEKYIEYYIDEEALFNTVQELFFIN